MFERLDTDARVAVVGAAREEALALGSASIEAEHLLLALAGDEDTATGRLLADAGLDREGVLEALDRESERSLAAVGVDLREFAPREPFLALAPSPEARRLVEARAGAGAARGDRPERPPHLVPAPADRDPAGRHRNGPARAGERGRRPDGARGARRGPPRAATPSSQLPDLTSPGT